MPVRPIDIRSNGEASWGAVSEAFATHGLAVLRNALDATVLASLRAEADLLRGLTDATYRLVGASGDEAAMPGERYSIAGCHRWRPHLASFIAGDAMRRLCRATIGCPAHLFTEQFLMKGPSSEMDFGWHQDGSYAPAGTPPFLVVWCALDDATELNGTLRILPGETYRSLMPHEVLPGGAERVARHAAEEGVPVPCRAGDIVAFSSLLPHRSENNRSAGWRRVYQVRYTPQPVVDRRTGRPLHFAKRVFD